MLVSLHEYFPIRVTDWLLSAILFSWGLALFAVEPEVWALPTFTGLHFASQFTWAVIATGIGLARLIALLFNGAVRRSPHARGVGAFLTIFIWVQLSLAVFSSNLVGPGIAIFPWLAIADIFNVYRAAQDARVSDSRAQSRDMAATRAPST